MLRHFTRLCVGSPTAVLIFSVSVVFAVLLRSILTNLLEESVLSKDAIRAWIKSEDPSEQGGRGVALKSINQFITWLEEPDDSPEEGP